MPCTSLFKAATNKSKRAGLISPRSSFRFWRRRGMGSIFHFVDVLARLATNSGRLPLSTSHRRNTLWRNILNTQQEEKVYVFFLFFFSGSAQTVSRAGLYMLTVSYSCLQDLFCFLSPRQFWRQKHPPISPGIPNSLHWIGECGRFLILEEQAQFPHFSS